MMTNRLPDHGTVWVRLALIGLAVTVVAGAALTAWIASGTRGPVDAAQSAWSAVAQTNEGGQVTITATLNDAGPAPLFRVVMETHAVDLDGYDLAALAALRTDQGTLVQPLGWDAPAGGHHREGTLTFPATTADGSPLITSNTERIDLIIRNVADVPERTLTWKR